VTSTGFRGHQTYPWIPVGFVLGPGFPRRSVRHSILSTAAMDWSLPSGFPVRSWQQSCLISSSDVPKQRQPFPLATRSESGASFTSASSFHDTWAKALLQGYFLPWGRCELHTDGILPDIAGRRRQVHLLQRRRSGISCQRSPRHPSRKFTRRVYRRWASSLGFRNPSSEFGTAIRCTWFGIRQYAQIPPHRNDTTLPSGQ
jgi:hypothetical protein